MKNGTKWMGAIEAQGMLWAYFLLVLTVCVFASGPAMGASTGTTGASFLKVAVGSRPAAMGSAYTAVAEGPYALHYNPASIGLTDRWEMSAMHSDQFAQINFDYFGLTAPAIKNRSAWGVSFVRMAVDDYARTELDDGAKFTNADIAVTGAYAHRIFKALTIGVSGKIIKQTLAQYSANGWALDVGAHLKLNPRLSIGAAFLHMGPKITFISIGDPLPTTFRVGGAFKLLPRGNLLATMDYSLPKDDADAVGIGLEYRPNRYVALRGGYQLGSDFTGFDASTYGITFDFDNFGVEYAFIPREKLGDVHRAGLNVAFGGKKPQVVASRNRPVRRARRSREVQTVRAPESQETHMPAPSRQRPDAAAPEEVSPPRPPERTKIVPEDNAPVSQRSVGEMMSLRRQAAAKTAEEAPVVSAGVFRPAENLAQDQSVVENSKPDLPMSAGVGDAGTWGRRAADPETSAPGARPTPEAEALTRHMSAAEREAIAQEKTALASSLMKEKRYREAVGIIKSGLVANPRSIPLWYLLSESLYKNGDYDEAMEAVNKALVIIHSGRISVSDAPSADVSGIGRLGN